MNIQSLREQRQSIKAEIAALLNANRGDKWKANPANQSDYEALCEKLEICEDEIDRHLVLIDAEADAAFGTEIARHAAKVGDRKLADQDPTKIFDKWLRGGDKALTAENWETIRNTMSTTTPAEGGYAVPSEVASQLIESLKAFGGMRAVADVFATLTGAPLSYPTSDGTAETGELISENTTATDLDASFGTVSLNTFKYSSKVVTVPIELLQDATIDMEAFVRARLATRLGRITNAHYTTGTGTGQPRGVITGAGLGKTGTTGQTTSVIYDDLIDLIHAVDPAYRAQGCGFMMNDSSLKVIRKLKDTQGRPLWEPNLQVGQPSSILGYPVTPNQDVAAMAANAKSIAFGQFSYYKIRDALAVTLFRFTDSAYAKKGQVGFLAWMRSGGNLTDAGAVKYYANSAT